MKNVVIAVFVSMFLVGTSCAYDQGDACFGARSMDELALLSEQVKECVREAGGILLHYFGSELERIAKPDGSFTTVADLETEAFLINGLRTLMPESSFFAEESGKEGSSDYCWVIDPLDGTTNYWHGIPYYCISVALTYKDEPVIAVLYNPSLDALYSAVKGHGTYLNGKCMHMKPLPLSESVILINPRYRENGTIPLSRLHTIRQKVQALRTFGSGALDLAMIVSGQAQGVLLRKLCWWDVAAGILIVQEAGGEVTTFQGNQVDPSYDFVLACHPSVYADLKALVNG